MKLNFGTIAISNEKAINCHVLDLFEIYNFIVTSHSRLFEKKRISKRENFK